MYKISWEQTEDCDAVMSEAPAEGTLEQIVEWSKAYNCRAVLTDEQGFPRGVVEADGNYRLS